MTAIQFFLLVQVLGAAWVYFQVSDKIFQLLAVVVGLACSTLLLALSPWPIHAILLTLLVSLDIPLLKQPK